MAKQGVGPRVVFVGRPNVGKSTLFNRITGTRRSIVAPVAGTTRDMVAAPAEWLNHHFTVYDTGGLFGATTDPLHDMVVEQGLRALETADIVVFMVDGREGLVSGDQDIAKAVRALNRPAILAVNKADDKRARARVNEFHELGFDILEVSAEHGHGVGDLLDALLKLFPEKSTEAELEEPEIAIAIVGRPNVGKSSLVNRLLREERVMVSDMPGTTRDSVDVILQFQQRRLRLVDTAGMRRPGKVSTSGQVESISVILAKRAMVQADVAVIMIDAVEGVTDRDAAIAGEAEEAGCGVVLVVNKWDLMAGHDQQWVKDYDDKLRYDLKFLPFAPMLHVSALTGERSAKVLEVALQVAEARVKRVSTSALNKFVEHITAANPPTSKDRRGVRILYAAQTASAPPRFVFFTNVATEFHFSYERFLVNQIREHFGFMGTPIRISVRRRTPRERDH
ncbi:MAG: ribosome biogenesis GTPase Der [Acidobacteria bacterium]|jgi:GTPase|nr:ribosome biogenesis GTPase Der [Acidobacteriota bacterium]